MNEGNTNLRQTIFLKCVQAALGTKVLQAVTAVWNQQDMVIELKSAATQVPVQAAKQAPAVLRVLACMVPPRMCIPIKVVPCTENRIKNICRH